MDETQPYRRARAPQARLTRRAAVRPRRGANWGRRIKVAAFLLAVVIVAGGVLLWQRAAAFNDVVSTESAYSTRLFGPFAGGDRVNVLLLGYSDESRDGAFLTDSMNVLSIHRETDETSLIAIPRDVWVEGLPEVPNNMKVNEAFAIGYYSGGLEAGAELASRAVSYVTGLPIHGWMALDFQGFAAMVDAIGGVTIENPTAFGYTWGEPNYLAGVFDGGYFDAGTLNLNGEEALTYARARYTSVISESSDFARSVRQQRVLQAIRAKVSQANIVWAALAVAAPLEDHLRTNISVLDLAMLSGKLEVDRRVELEEDVILQATTNSIGQYVLVVIGRSHSADYAPLHAYITSALSEPIPIPSVEPSAESATP